MTEVERVPAPRVPLGGRADLAAILLIAVVTMLVAKPWGSAAGPLDATPYASGPPTPTPGPTAFVVGYPYEQAVFGPFEPRPEWSIWPAGFFVTVLYVTREAVTSPAPVASGSDAALPLPSASRPAGSVAPDEAAWPAVISIRPGDHLLWLGIDTPVAWTVRGATVWWTSLDGARSRVPVVQLASSWGPNFSVIGIPAAQGSDRLAIWEPGVYEVDVRLDPGSVMRSFRVNVAGNATGPTATPEIRPDQP
ncbi:MAG: hypothetical protein HYX57_06285 [Chloroflexi bacterium]|nr:hypothetical protein [Chloroflexota bacterium]